MTFAERPTRAKRLSVLVYPGHAPSVAARLTERDSVCVESLAVDAADDETLAAADCLLVEETSLPAAAVGAIRAQRLPVVAVTDDSAATAEETDWVDGHVRREGDATEAGLDRVVDELRRAVDSETRIQLRDARDRIASLSEAAASFGAVDDPDELYERLVSVGADVLDVEGCWVRTPEDLATDDPEWLQTRVAVGDLCADRLSVTGTVGGEAFRTGESRVVVENGGDSDLTPADGRVRSGLSVPIGEFAVFQAGSTDPGAVTEVDRELAELLCQHATAARRRLAAELTLQTRRERLAALHGGTAELAESRSREALFDRVVAVAEEVLSFDQSFVYVADDDADVFRLSAASVPEPPETLPLDYGVLGRTYEENRSFLAEDIPNDVRAGTVTEGESRRSVAEVRGYESGLSVPIGDAAVFQALAADSGGFTDDDLELAELLASYLAGALTRLDAEADRRQEHERLEALFENVPDAAVEFVIEDGDPVVRRVNSAFETGFGYDAETVVGENIDEYIVPPDGWSDAAAMNDRLREGRNVRQEVERLTADGPRHFLLHVVPISLDETNVAGFAIYTDVTERERRERELRRRNERLDQFASVVSHDLRNPLNVAKGYVDLAQESGDLGHLDRATTALSRIDDLVTDLLTLARKGEVIDDIEPVAVEDVAEAAWESVEAGDAGTSLQVQTIGEVNADERRLAELLENCYRNATEHAGEDVTVEVGPISPRGDGETGFYVADDGVGLPEDCDVFEAGVTTDDGGTGFGLAIVRRIAEAHGWQVAATESEPGGARFEFRPE